MQLWPLLRQGMVLDHQLENRRVRAEIAWLRKHPDFFTRLAPRFKRYGPHIYREIHRRGMPAELFFIAVIESALDPFAFSPGGAAGLWQFMPATGKRFGLKVDWWADERRDPLLATGAALDYLQLLYRRFDDWYLAIAAYNAGEGRMSRAVRNAGGSRDFFALRVPRETAGYVPRLLAFAAVFKEPEKHGFQLPDVMATDTLTSVWVGSQLDISRAATALDVSVDQVYDWNPALNRWATHPRGPHRLLVGHFNRDAQALIDAIPAAERLTWSRYRIKPGDTLSEIATAHNTDSRTLMSANRLPSALIRTGDTLLIPLHSGASESPLPARRAIRGKKSYRVVRGDSLWEIAQRFDISLAKLMRMNQIGPTETLRIGQRLIVSSAEPASTRPGAD